MGSCEETLVNAGRARFGARRGPSDPYNFPRFAREHEAPPAGRRKLVPQPAVERPTGMRFIPAPSTDGEDPYGMGVRPNRRVLSAATTEVRGPSAYPVIHAERRTYPDRYEQKYQCWRPETLGNVSQWSDGPGVYNLTDVAEPKGSLVPYITDMRGGRKLFPERKPVSSLHFAGPFNDGRGKPIDYFLAKNGGTLRERLFPNEDIGGQNPYIRAERQLAAAHGLSSAPAAAVVAPPAPLAYNSRGDSLSRLEYM